MKTKPKSSLKLSDNSLLDFVASQPNAMHIKDVKTGGYICVNKPLLSIFGLKKNEEILNRNVFDIDKFMRPYWGENYPKTIAAMDMQVAKSGQNQILKNDILLDANNHVYIQDIMKFPLLSKSNKIAAILTTIKNRTYEIDLFCLFNLYTSMYPTLSCGLKKFTEFLHLTDFFQEDLTYKEILCLLHMRLDSSYKNVARKLNIGQKTVETHVSNILHKLKHSNISTILAQLRSKENP